MLPPFIIEQIRRREEQDRKQYEQPQLELPVHPSPPREPKRREETEDGQRGVIILELAGGASPLVFDEPPHDATCPV